MEKFLEYLESKDKDETNIIKQLYFKTNETSDMLSNIILNLSLKINEKAKSIEDSFENTIKDLNSKNYNLLNLEKKNMSLYN